MNVVVLCVGVLIVVCGILFLYGAVPRNHFLGMRTRATMSSPEAWDKAHRACGPVFVLSSLVACVFGVISLVADRGPFAVAGFVASTIGVLISCGQAQKAAKAHIASAN